MQWVKWVLGFMDFKWWLVLLLMITGVVLFSFADPLTIGGMVCGLLAFGATPILIIVVMANRNRDVIDFCRLPFQFIDRVYKRISSHLSKWWDTRPKGEDQ
jgi:hypothetical protein